MSDSIWKKEISFSRKKPQPDAAPEASAAPVESEPAEPKQSIWKKDLSLSHKAPKPEAAPEASADPAPAEPKQSFWKKEISFSHKDAAPQESAPPAEAAPAALATAMSIEQHVLGTARRNRGQVTAVTVAADGGISIDQARDELERLAKTNACLMDISSDGRVVFRFPEFETPESKPSS